MIFEERRMLVAPSQLDEYLSRRRSELIPSIRSAGGEVICLLSGLIGNPQNEFVQITSWRSLYAWRQAQAAFREGPSELHLSEEVRLLDAISSRPKTVVPEEDRRPIYGFRRFFIHPQDLDEFVNCSENGIWPRIEAMDACILGLWTTASETNPQEIIIATGYRSPSHWEKTRYEGAPPPGVDKALWDNEDGLRRRRVEITLQTWVCLMRAHQV